MNIVIVTSFSSSEYLKILNTSESPIRQVLTIFLQSASVTEIQQIGAEFRFCEGANQLLSNRSCSRPLAAAFREECATPWRPFWDSKRALSGCFRLQKKYTWSGARVSQRNPKRCITWYLRWILAFSFFSRLREYFCDDYAEV